MNISIVIPAYNEEQRIKQSIYKILNYFKIRDYDYEIILVDDGSIDNTIKVVEGFHNHKIKILKNQKNLGKGAAAKKGVLAAQKEWILITDADLSAPISELDKFLKYQNYEVLIGSRGLNNSRILVHQPLYRKLGGKFLNFFIQILVLPGIKDTQCGFKLFQLKAAQKIFNKQTLNSFSFDVEILFIAKKKNMKILELPIVWTNNSNTKVLPFHDGFRLLRDLVKIRLNDFKKLYD